jgi:transposase
MKLYTNAGLSLKGRRLLVDRVLVDRWSIEQVANAAGVSERTACEWLARFRCEGEQGCSMARQHQGTLHLPRPRSVSR